MQSTTSPWWRSVFVWLLPLLVVVWTGDLILLRAVEQARVEERAAHEAEALAGELAALPKNATRIAHLEALPPGSGAVELSSGEEKLYRREANEASGAPGWFVSLAGIEVRPQMRVVSDGNPPVSLWFHAATAEENARLWRSWTVSSMLFSAVLLLLLAVGLASNNALRERLRRVQADLTPLARRIEAKPATDEETPESLVNELHTQQRSQQTAIEDLRRLLFNLSDAAFVVDPAGIVTLWSPTAERLFGFSSEEIVGEPATRLVPPWRREEFDLHLREALGGTTLENVETQQSNRLGQVRQVLRTVSPYREMGGERITAALFSVRDISALRELEGPQRLRAAALAACNCGLLITDAANGNVLVDINPVAAGLLGDETSDLLNRPLELVCRESGDPDVVDRLRAGFTQGSAFRVRWQAGRDHKHPLWLEMKLTPLQEGSVPSHYVGALRDVSDGMRMEETLKLREERLDSIVDSAPVGLIILSPRGILESANPAFCTLIGEDTDNLLGQPFQDWLTEDLENVLQDQQESPGRSRELHLKNRAGRKVTVLASIAPLEGRGSRPGFVLFVLDITARKRAEQRLFQEIERAQVTLEAIADAVITTNDKGVVEYLNPVAEQLTGWSTQDAQGLELDEVLNLINEKSRDPEQDPVQRCLRLGRRVEISENAMLVRGDGREVPVLLSAAPIHDREGRIAGSVLIFREVTEIRRQVRRMSYEARHDALTGLYNRREFTDRLTQALEEVQQEGHPYVLCYLDLDNFKTVNDTAGHLAGDELLKQVAALIRSGVRDADTVARLGGDEFAVLLNGCTEERGRQIADNLVHLVREYRFAWQDRLYQIGVSIGLLTLHAGELEQEAVLKAADHACYAAKQAGRNRVYIFSPTDTETLGEAADPRGLRRVMDAVEHDHLQLFQQPIRPLGSEPTAAMAEILVRMADEEGRLLNPRSFLPTATRFQRMVEIDRWVVGNLFAYIGRRDSLQSLKEMQLFINISGQSVKDDRFLDFVVDQARRSGVRTDRIALEISETDLIANYSQCVRFMQELERSGFKFAVDDFGSGLSTFASLRGLPVSFLKVGRQLISRIGESAFDRSVLQALNQVAHSLPAHTIAKHVEDAGMLPMLRELAVDYVQGYVVGIPIPLHEEQDPGEDVPQPIMEE